MSDLSDSDGAWVLVDKETDSETSSIVAVCETEVPVESFPESEVDDIRQNDWCNHDEIITDSDIEACVEETPSSEDVCGFSALISSATPTEQRCEVETTLPEDVITKSCDLGEDEQNSLSEETDSQSELVKTNSLDSLQEEENELETDVSILENYPSTDLDYEWNNSQKHVFDFSVQTVVDNNDAFTETEDKFDGDVDGVTTGPGRKLAFSFLMIGVGFVLGRCSMSHPRLVSNCAVYHYNESPLRSVGSMHPKMNPPSLSPPPSSCESVSSTPCSIDTLEPTLKGRIEKEFERQKTYIQLLKADLQRSQDVNMERTEHFENDLHNKEFQLKRLQHEHKHAVKDSDNEKKRMMERYSGMKLRVQRYRSESNRLMHEMSKCKIRSRRLRTEIEQRSFRLTDLQEASVVSPLLYALRNESQTCQTSDRLKSEVEWRENYMKNQTQQIQRLEMELQEKSLAVETLYKSVTDLKSHALTVNDLMKAGDRTESLYAHLIGVRSGLERKLKIADEEYRHLKDSYSATNHSRAIAKRQKAILKERLATAKDEIKQLRNEQIALNAELQNVTMELKKKSSVQHCMKSAIANELDKLNDTRLYKAANNAAEKVANVSRKAWSKLETLAKKLSQSEGYLHAKSWIVPNRKEKCEKQTYSRDRERRQKKKNRRSDRWSKLHDSSDGNREGSKSKDTKTRKQYGRRETTDKAQESETAHDFDVFVSGPVEMVKKAGETVMHHLAPVYDKYAQAYQDVKSKMERKSFQDVWDSVVESVMDDNQGDNEQSEEKLGWVWEAYENFTDYLQPAIPDSMPYSWMLKKHTRKHLKTVPKQQGAERDVEEIPDVSPKTHKVSKDPEWFHHMFRGREMLRREKSDSPLSEEEFDWFLQMFAERERLRHSDDDEYPEYDIDKEMDWYLKMFEARARLRFQNEGDNKNWYIKMSNARRRARMRRQELSTSQWYADMFQARKNIRESNDKVEWYDNMARMRKEMRGVAMNGDKRCKA